MSKKLKKQFIKSINSKALVLGIIEVDNFIHRKNGIIRKFSTKQEKSCSIMHEIEYKEYGLKIRAKRNNSLIDDREDKTTTLVDSEKDWKRNSKRSHQYYK